MNPGRYVFTQLIDILPRKNFEWLVKKYDGNRTFVFYTNNFEVTAEQVALLYKYRWRVELFFKWLKQHLRIKEFYGTSENAIKIQIYAAIIAYCLVVIVQECMGLKLQTYDVLRILSTASLTKMPLCDLLVEQKEEESTEGKYQQLCLNFDGQLTICYFLKC